MFAAANSRRVASVALRQSRAVARRFLSDGKTKVETTAKEAATKAEPVAKKVEEEAAKPGIWHSAEFWGGMGALAGWGMSGAAIYDAAQQGPEVISMTMTPVLIVYSTLFARWAWVVKPRNLLLMGCHVTNVAAQLNQLRRALEHKSATGQQKQVDDLRDKTMVGGAVLAGSLLAGPHVRQMLTKANLGVVTTVAAADAGPFTVHFWAPMSKWLISGASFLELDRPTDKISLPQYTALTLTGFFFSRYSLLVIPINYTLCSVNVALFGSSAWHLGRKIKADYID
ncbi:pyruvate carrier 2 [Seminavis robusta]|uniref:Mitochondrial pyruvate carrier n=1 Tax=Seminavis robusta TaxID=568900 RepID=A0A9N8HBP3_9STRA|nr:pyruvate carrier 2 [Seminavis robusta]|eukprot:Sro372_g128780.1 pyruvate carrier 2 (284) ;mRNA; r:30077-30928